MSHDQTPHHVGVARFAGTDGAERAFSHARDGEPRAAWLGDAALVEAHRGGRIVVRGSVAGHYVDLDGERDPMGRETGIGAVAGAAAGLALGPSAVAIGLVGGAIFGGSIEAGELPRPEGPAFDAIREQVPEGASAIVVVSDAARVEAMGVALAGAADAIERYGLSPAAATELQAALAQAPLSTGANRPAVRYREPGGMMRDHTLERRVADALAADPHVDDDAIAVECGESGYAVLRGASGNPAMDGRALRTASAVTGVDGVNNQLRPRRPGVGPRQDARMEAAVLRAFIADDALPAETMHVSASDGTVTLRGRVDFASQRDEAEAVARRVPGVSKLRNELDVWTAISPNQVLEQVTGAMGGHRADHLTVTARDNVVTLSGTVRSAADRDAAVVAAADVPFVARVEDEIRVVA